MKPADNSLNDKEEVPKYDSSLESQIPTSSAGLAKLSQNTPSPFRYNKTAMKITVIALVVMALVGGGSFAINLMLTGKQTTKLNSAQNSSNFAVGRNLSLQHVKISQQLELGQANQLTINGKLNVSKSLTLNPTINPSAPGPGEIYYNQLTNLPYFFNGSRFVALNPIENQTSQQTSANFNIQSAAASDIGAVIAGAASQTADLLDLNNSSGTILSGFNSNGDLYYNNSGYSATINSATLSAAQTITIPNATGTICLQSNTSCGFASSSGSGSYIQNTTTQQASSDFNISGSGVIGATLNVSGATTLSSTLAVSGTASFSSKLGIGTATPAYPLDVVGNINTSGNYLINGTQISSSNLANSANIALLNATQTFTGANTFSGSTTTNGSLTATGTSLFKDSTNSTTAFQVQNAAGATILSTDTTANQVNISGNLNLNQVAAPTTAPTATVVAGTTLGIGNYYYVVAYVTANGTTNYGPVSAVATTISGNQAINLTNIPTSPSSLVTARKIYRTLVNGDGTPGAYPEGPFYLVTTINDNVTTTYSDVTPDSSLGAAASDITLASGVIEQNGSPLIVTGGYNLGLGIGALQSNTIGIGNTASGDQSLQDNTIGFYDTASGWLSLQDNTTGIGNTASGDSALQSNTTGNYNTAFGNDVLAANTTANNNTGVGDGTLENNTTGIGNTGLGAAALANNSTGNYNTASGFLSLYLNTTGNYNTASGLQSLYFNTTGSNNVSLGYGAGMTSVYANANTTGSNNTFIGYQSGPGVASSSSLQNATAIGNLAVVDTSNSLVLGSINGVNGATASTNVGIGTTSPTQTLDVLGTGLFQSSTNSTTAFQVQNAAGATILSTDTTANQVNISGNISLNQVAAPTTAPTATVVAGTTLGIGNYYYVVAYVTANGTTNYGPVSAVATTTSSNQAINLTNIPISSNSLVIARNIYRTVVNSPLIPGDFPYYNNTIGPFYLVTTINNNATTTYTDTTPDSSLGTIASAVNLAGSVIEQNNSPLFVNAGGGIGLGQLSLQSDTTGYTNSAFGYSSLRYNTEGINNNATGDYTLSQNTTGSGNDATGAGTLQSNTTGSNNAAGGYFAIGNNTTGNNNTAYGMSALWANTTGNNNVSLGYQAGYTSVSANANTTGSGNTFIGYQSGPGVASSSSLQNATAIGNLAVVDTSNSIVLGSINGINGATASTNVGIGTTSPTQTLDVLGTGLFQSSTNSTTAFQVQNAAGATILSTDTTANQVNISGNINLNLVSAPSSAPSVSVNTTTGNLNGTYYYVYAYVTPSGITNYSPVSASVAPASQEVNVTVAASSNLLVTGINIYRTAGGSSSGPFYLVNSSPLSNANQTYIDNVADSGLGLAGNDINLTASLQQNGSTILIADPNNYNTGVGIGVLQYNTTGSANTASGFQALQSNTTGSANTAFGFKTLYSNTTGSGNTASGFQAFQYNTTGSYNAASGFQALQSNTTGSGNTALGFKAGVTSSFANANTAGSNNTFIGNNSGPGVASSSSLQNATAIGNQAVVDTSNSLVLGSINGVNGATASANVGIGTASPSSTLDVVASSATTIGQIIQGAASQTADLLQVQNSSGTVLSKFAANGNLTVGSPAQVADGNIAISNNGDNSLTIERGGTGAEYLRVLAAAGGSSGLNNVYTIDRVSPTTSTSRSLLFRHSTDGGSTYTTDLTITGTGNVGVGTTTPAAQLQVNTSSATTVGQIIQGAASQTADLLDLNNSSAAILSGFNSSGDLYYNNSGYSATINSATLSASQTITIPNATGTICLQSNAACGFAPTSGSTSYIQNTTTQQASSDFNISGSGVIGTTLSVSGATTLSSTLTVQGTGSSSFAGNVGIGTTTPVAQLQVGTLGSSTIQTGRITFNTNNSASIYESYGVNIAVPTGASQAFRVNNSTSTLLYVGTDGLLGIGTVNPQQALNLSSGDTIATNMAIPTSVSATLETTASSNAAGTYYYVVTALDGAGGQTVASSEVSATTTSTDPSVQISWAAVPGAASYNVYRGTTSGGENVYYNTTATSFTDTGATATSASLPTVTTAYVNKISASGNSYFLGGNVGLGTGIPSSTLDVVGTAHFSGGSTNGLKIFTSVGGYTGPAIISDNSQSLLLNPNGNSVLVGSNGGVYNTSLEVRPISSSTNPFSIDNSAGTASYLFVNNVGNVGIGTTSPSATLQVNAAAVSNHPAVAEFIDNGGATNNGGPSVLIQQSGNYSQTAILSVEGTNSLQPSPILRLLQAGTGEYLTANNGSIEVASIGNGGSAYFAGNLNLAQTAAPTTAPTLTVVAGTTLGIGNYYYVVAYVTASGTTNYGPVSTVATTTSSNQAINLSVIPTSPSSLVTARKIYRTDVGGTTYGPFYLVTTINDNTTTTYSDTTADTSLGAGANDINYAGGVISQNSTPLIVSTGNNLALGTGALQSNTTGIENIATGQNALALNTTGNGNTASGFQALQSNTTGSANTASGFIALQDNTTGNYNTATGGQALQVNTTGYGNTASGVSALNSNTTGNYNTATGQNALALNTTGSNNTVLGYEAGYTTVSANANTTGSNNTFIGYNSGPGVASSSSLQNATAIGTNSVVDTSNSLVLGSINGTNGATASTNVGIGTASPTTALDVQGSNATGFISTLYNTSTATSAGTPTSSSDGLLIQLGTLNANRTTGNTFIGFADSTGTLAGAIVGGATAVAYSTTGADYSEYFLANPSNLPTPGELVSLGSTNNSVAKSVSNVPIGIVSTNPGFIGNGPLCKVTSTTCQTNYNKTNVIVALTGQVPTTVSVANGNISIGDPITSSSTPGVGELATSPGYIVGYALTPTSTNGTIQVLINPGYYTPSNTQLLQANSAILNSLSVNGAINSASINNSGLFTTQTLSVSGNASIGGNLTVMGMTTVQNLSVDGHIITNGIAPTAQVTINAGSGATVSVKGNDISGTITINTGEQVTTTNTTTGQVVIKGNNPTSGDMASIIFNKAYGSVPHILVTPNNSKSAPLMVYPNKQSTTSFDIGLIGSPKPNTTYTYEYFIVQ